jgi:uncharacterized membrane-anchored protein
LLLHVIFEALHTGDIMKIFIQTAFLSLLLFSGLTLAQEKQDEEQAFLKSLSYQSGNVAISEANARFELKPGFKYLAQADARKVLEDYWGNPPDETVLGLIVPEKEPLGSEHSWAVVVTYNSDGYVSDEDASKIDYTDMLKDMQADTEASNEYRVEQGYEKLKLIGWAETPRYDAATKRMYWAKEIAFEGSESNTLNYDIRVLGRQGYLSLEAVASMQDLARVNEGMKQILPMAQFNTGNTYADYNPSTDKLAAYGLAALVGGGVAAKTGLLAKLGALLLAGKKFIVIIFIALAAFVKKIFSKKDKKTVE